MDEAIRAQYEAYPYPPRDPADEARRLITGSPGRLVEVDHYLFAGRRDFARPFRALVAGGGTGDATVMLAQELADVGAAGEVVHLDASEAATAIAEGRIRARGLANATFRRGDIAAAPDLGLGRFDYIDCCGVLHHLEDPAAGLRTLRDMLAPDGGMGLMLYAPLGRTGVYPAQAMLRTLCAEETPAAKVAIARRLLSRLPPTNWLRRNPFLSDHAALGDAGIYDLLLHGRDRAYGVMEVADLLARAGLRPVAFVDPARYDPASYLEDAAILRRLRALTPLERCAFAERLCGNMRVHVFYAVRAEDRRETVARPDTPAMIPILQGLDAAQAAQAFAAGKALRIDVDGFELRIRLPPSAAPILARIDGEQPLGALHRALAAAQGRGMRGWGGFRRRFARIHSALNGVGRMFLRDGDRDPRPGGIS